MGKSVKENILALREDVAQLARASQITIVLVTKTVSPERIQEALDCGMKILGENRVQELVEKEKFFQGRDIAWHMIGHLQTNKVKQILEKTELIQSLDRLELAEEIERQAVLKKIRAVNCLIQVNSSGESTKYGLRPDELEEFVRSLKGPAIQIQGLMTLGPLTSDEVLIRKSFRKVKELQEKMKKSFPEKKWDILSMGMSNDYRVAIEEGSTMIRVGTAVFGERK